MLGKARHLLIFALLLTVFGIEGQREGARQAIAQSGSGSSSSAVSRNINLVGSIGGSGGGLATDGNVAYIGHGNRVIALDVSTPASLRVMKQSPMLPGFVRDIELAGSYLYVASGLGGVRVLDRATLQEVGAYPTPSVVYDVFIQEPYAFLAEKEGLRILDITDRAAPRLVHFMYTSAIPVRVAAFRSRLALLYDFAGTVELYDLSQPMKPVPIGQLSVPGIAKGVWFSDNRLFVVNCCVPDSSQQGLSIFDVSNPSAPVRLGFVAIFAPEDVVVLNHYAYVAAYRLHIVDISDPSYPRIIHDGYGVSPYYPRRVQASFSTVYAIGEDMFFLIGVANPSSPQLLGSYTLPGPKPSSFKSIYASGLYAYLTDQKGFQVVDLSTPSQPRNRGSLQPPVGYFYRFSVDGSYAFVANGNYLRVVDISNPDAPRLVSSAVPNSGYMDAVDVKVWGSYVLVSSAGDVCGSGTGLLIFERVSPAYPVHVASVPGTGRSFGLFVAPGGSRTYAYVADACGMLHVIDVTNPAAPARIASLSLPGTPYNVHVVLPYAYVAAGSGGVLVVDVSSPSAPRLIGRYEKIPHVVNAYARGARLYATSYKGLYVLDLLNPTNLQEIAYVYGSGADAVFANDSYVFVGDYQTGLGLFSLISGTPGPINRPPVARMQMCAGNTCRREGELLNVEIPSGQATVRLSGTESTDPDGDLLSYRWTVDGNPAGMGREVTVSLNPGEHTVVLTVEDGRGGKSDASGRIRVRIAGSDGARLKDHKGLISGSTVLPGEVLAHMWSLQNTGGTTWDPASYWIERVSGSVGPDQLTLPRRVFPGDYITIVWQASAPLASGNYAVSYRLRGPQGYFGPILSFDFNVASGDTTYGQAVLREASKLLGMQYSSLPQRDRAKTINGGIINTPTGYFSFEGVIFGDHKQYYSNLGRLYFKYGVCTDVVIDGTYFGLSGVDLAKGTSLSARNTDCMLQLFSGNYCGNKSLSDVLGSGYRVAVWRRLSPNQLSVYVRVRPGDLIFFKWKQGAFNPRQQWDPRRETHHVGVVKSVTSDGRILEILDNGDQGGLRVKNWGNWVWDNTEWLYVVRVLQVSGAAGLPAPPLAVAQAALGEEAATRLVITLEGAGVTMDVWDGEGRFAPTAPDPSWLAVHEHAAIPYILGAEWVEIAGAQVVTITAPAEERNYLIRLRAGSSTGYRLQARLMQGDQVIATAEQANPIADVLMVPLYIGQEEEGFRMQMAEPMPEAGLILPQEGVSGSGTSGTLRIEFPIRADPARGTARKMRLSLTPLAYGFFDVIPPERIRMFQGPVDLASGEIMTGWVEVDLTGLPPGSYVGRVIVRADNAIPQSMLIWVEVRPEHRVYLPLVLRGR
jgi:hypothetical protein